MRYPCLTLFMLGALALSACAQPIAAQETSTESIAVTTECPVSPPETATPPDDPNADPFGSGPWFINTDHTVWAYWGLGWQAGQAAQNKVIWIRPAKTELVLSGQRLDAEAPPMEAVIPCCYATGFQVTGLYFPTGGCWEVMATAGESQLVVVVELPALTNENP